jgi:hypothetical protein
MTTFKLLVSFRRTAIVTVLISTCWLPVTAEAQSPPSYTQFDSWQFENTNWFSVDGYAPVSSQNLVNTNAGNGNCLLLDTTNNAWLQYNLIENDGATNLTIDRGTVLFWFSPSWSGTNAGGSGPGHWGRLFEVGEYTTNASIGWWSIYLNPEGTHIYFSSQTNNGSGANYLAAPITWTNGDWHHIALTYSTTNSTLYLDGQLATNGSALAYWPGPDVQADGFFIGSDLLGVNQARGFFDDLSTYDGPLDAATIASIAGFWSIIYEDNPFSFTNAYSQPSFGPPFYAITGSGLLNYLSNATSCVESSNIWITNVVASLFTNHTLNVVFTLAGGTNSNGIFYDVFANASLTPSEQSYHWAWMGQAQTCTVNMLTNMPLGDAYLILGKPMDSDEDGLTDAYELLITHTDPNDADTDGDGVDDGIELLQGRNPLVGAVTDTDGVVNLQVYTPLK